MSNNMLRKTAVALAAAGLLFVPVSTSAAAAEPQAVQSSYAYPGYYGKVITKTSVKLNRSVVKEGQHNVARITVASGSIPPSGRVHLVVKGIGSVGSAVVRNGVATIRFGKALSGKRTYRVKAVFVGNKTFRGSGDTADFTVIKHRKPHRR